MWWKMPLLFLIGSPLALWGAKEFHSHPETIQPRAALPSKDALRARKADHKKLADEVKGKLLDEDLARLVLAASREPGALRKRSRENQDLLKRLNDHCNSVREVSCLAETFGDLEKDPAKSTQCTHPSYKTWLDEKRGTVKAIRAQFDALLPKFASTRIEIASDLERPSRNVDQLATVQKKLKEVLGEFVDYRKLCAAFPTIRADVDKLLDEGRAHDSLLEILLLEEDRMGVRASSDRESVVTHLDRYSLLLKQSGLPAAFQVQAREQLNRFAKAYLPERMEEDTKICFYPRGRSFPPFHDEVSKDRITVVFKDGKDLKLSKSEDYSEWNPPPVEKISYFRLELADGGGSSQGDKIAPTSRSKVARYYNERRKSVQLNEEALRDFVNTCPEKWEDVKDMPAEFQRISHLLAAMKKHPGLSGTNR